MYVRHNRIFPSKDVLYHFSTSVFSYTLLGKVVSQQSEVLDGVRLLCGRTFYFKLRKG